MAWLSQVESLSLLDVYSLRPLVDGTRLQNALGVKGGKWTGIATEIVIEWQLLNPEETDPNKAVNEVQRRRGELDLTQ